MSLLQCAIPVFEGLLPEPHNTHVLMLLFNLAHWHGLAKLRMHIDPTVDTLSQVTTSFGNSLRAFKERTCEAFPTRELERERVARTRRQEKSVANTGQGSAGSKRKKPASNTREPKQLNLRTYTHHALGDYADTIRRVGTTDSYSTQPVSIFVTPCLILLNNKAWTRVNANTEPRSHGSSGLVADQYQSNSRGLNNDSVGSRQSVRT
jgi:hypothetical protein